MRRLALITGGTGAIGSATAELLAPNHDLALVYATRHDRAGEVREHIDRTFPSVRVKTFAICLHDHSDCVSLVKQVKEEFARSPDVLVTLSGGLYDSLFIGSDFTLHEALLSEHLLVPMSLCHLLLEDMYKNKYGRIVNVGSISASYVKRGQASYAAAKSGLEGFTRSIALEVAHRNVTANVVVPGLINTSFAAGYIAKLHSTDVNLKRRIPAGYIGAPIDAARVISFLCSEDARYINGSIYTVDGGRSLGDSSL
jgi:3-oxoacyl-[acyl-carrier protein] reductase